VATQVIVLNGGSSSGKSGIARYLQTVLPDVWLTFGVDTLIQAMPASAPATGIEFGASGEVVVGPRFRALEAAWMEGIAAMARTGARIIVDEVFLGGATSQGRWARALDGLEVLWVGVRCDGAVAAVREIARGDRMTGMAASQAEVVHQGVVYDLEVDTTHTEAVECARAIAARVELPVSDSPRRRVDYAHGVFAGQCFRQVSAGSGQSRPQNFHVPRRDNRPPS
jgi:chloramphenicol 3-O phosphotransferase